LRLHHVHDGGDADFLDVHEFQPVDEDEDFGEGRLVGRYPDAETVLEAAVVIGARPGSNTPRVMSLTAFASILMPAPPAFDAQSDVAEPKTVPIDNRTPVFSSACQCGRRQIR
jgi:hypothetical protein